MGKEAEFNAKTQRGKPQPKPEIAAKNAKITKIFNHGWSQIFNRRKQKRPIFLAGANKVPERGWDVRR